MSKTDKKLNEVEITMKGCYGTQVTYEGLVDFLQTNFQLNFENEKTGLPRFAQCIWGHSGIGKTMMAKSFKHTPIEWGGKKWDGFDIRDVPIAQFEEMGDLHGMPVECFLMKSPKGEETWVNRQFIDCYRDLKYELVAGTQSRTMYSPPDWVPLKPGPSILILDDWNRASIRIIKGIMQLLQNHAMISWLLPPGCNIILTGNPDEQDYLVTTIDKAILTRIKHVTLKHDVKEWAVWATAQQLDSRGINFLLTYPEMMVGKERTNPRTLTEFFRFLKMIPNIESEREKVNLHAHSLLDEETVAAFFVFCTREMEMVIEPDDILDGKEEAKKHIEKLMNRKEPRVDILGVICERLYARMVQPTCEMSDPRIKNFQEFITMEVVPEDMRHSLCRRIAKKRDGKSQKWLLGNKILKNLILDTLR
jgi:hypothetical protein